MPLARTLRALAIALVVPLVTACWIFRPDVAFNPPNPFTEIRVVAVAPVFDMTIDRNLVDTDDGYPPLVLGELMASELIQFADFEVIRPQVVAVALGDAQGWHPNDPEGPTIARRVMEALGADAILVSAVTEFDPYREPRVAVAAQLYASARAGARGPDVGAVIQSGRPFPIDAGRRQGLLISFERMFDSKQRHTQAELGAYARYRNDVGERGLDPEKVYSWDVENYLRFAFNRVLHEVVDDGEALQEAWNHGVDE